jgi:hypothetical protein
MKMPSKSDDKQGMSVSGRGRPRVKPPAGLTMQEAAMAAGLAPQPRPMPMRAPPPGVVPMKNGGSASSRADGCCAKGKTKGKLI